MRACFVIICLIAVALPVTSANANLILNGSFEEGSLSGVPFVSVPTGSTAISGWTVTAQVDWYNSFPLWFASDGSRSIDLQGIVAGGIEQTFLTTPGHAYEVTFDMAGNSDGGPAIKTLSVLAAGQSQDFNFDTTGQSSFLWDWTTYHWTFTATGFQTTLEFFDASSAALGFGATLDNVVVNALPAAPVPEPSTLLITASGFATWGAMAWRRHRASREA